MNNKLESTPLFIGETKSEEAKTIEAKENKETGKNVEVSLHIIRHGEKNETGGLSYDGKLKAEEKGENLEQKTTIKDYFGIRPRLRETAESIKQSSGTKDKKDGRRRSELAHTILSTDFSKSEFVKKVDEGIEKINLLPGDERNKAFEEFEQEYQKEWLSYGESKPDKYMTSPLVVAKKMAQLINFYKKMPNKLENGSRVDLIAVTHEFMLAAVVKYLLKKKEGEQVIQGDELFSRIKRIDYLDDIDFVMKNNELGVSEIKVIFRDEEYELDNDAMDKLLQNKDDVKQN